MALGLVFNQAAELAVLSPLFGQAYQRAKASNTKEEFVHSREATGSAVALGTSFIGSALQSYGVGALINATGTLSYKGAAYLGGLIFVATSAPTVCSVVSCRSSSGCGGFCFLTVFCSVCQFLTQLFTEKRALEAVGLNALAKVFETVGLSLFLTWWGTRTNPFDL